MSLTLYVDGTRLRDHVGAVAGRTPGFVPVAKGNGYGLTNRRLALEAQNLRADTLALGTYDEIEHVARLFTGDLLVLTPFRPFGTAATFTPDRRLIHTVTRVEDIPPLLQIDPHARFVLERMTSLRTHGLSARDMRAMVHALAKHTGPDSTEGPVLEGIAFDFPATEGGHLTELHRLMTDVVSSGLPTRTIWVGHLTEPELIAARSIYPDVVIRPRLGAELWLGDPTALRVRAHVLDLHRLERGSTFGYRGRAVPRRGHLLVVSGGAAHGIGLEAPAGDLSLRSRATTLARGSLDAAGLVRSPYVVDGKPRYFAEPPHAQASLLYLPDEAELPAIGDEVEVRARLTTMTFDQTVVS
ncbi:alanine racemase [Nocardioides cavernaquae]|uniref:Alanine racemase n=1 Tax=Nocardioides cavernaquae TaxID=2321396 RepID=A0A3A5H572_9ACTN|nr:alanine racemase [Nocardioides cavernaquae]RJS45722.1 alanine racemase [Nocardioides cavernaquae]